MKRFDDQELVEAYKTSKTCRGVAEIFGCSDETVRRALIKYDVPRVTPKDERKKPRRSRAATREELETIAEEYCSAGITINELAKKYHRSQGTISKGIKQLGYEVNSNPSRKITDEQIISDIAEGLTQQEIIDKRGIHVTNLWRRMKKLGVHARRQQQKKEPEWHWTLGAANMVERCQDGRYELVEFKNGRLRIRCKQCGSILERARSTVRQKHCECEYCRNEKELEEARIRLARTFIALINAKTPKVCQSCGEEFYSRYSNAKYCSEKCRRKKKKRANGYRGRARKYGVFYDPSVTRIKIIARDKCTCQICGGKCDPNDLRWGTLGPLFPTVDHIIPLAKGGPHTFDNCQCAHAICNSEKRDLITA